MIPVNKLPKLGLQASNAERWVNCTISPGLILANADKITESTSAAADEGTLAHLRAAESLLLGYDKKDFGKNHEMAGFVLDYVTYVRARAAKATMLVEQNIKLFYMVDRNGFIDVCLLGKWGMTIIDFKYGRGVSVEAEDNKQMLIYARSMIDRLERDKVRKFKSTETVEMIIYQPRVYGEEAERLWSMTVGELRERTDEIGEIAHAIQKNPHKGSHLKFAPSDKACQFCPLAEHALCPAYTAWILGGVPADPELILDAPKRGIELPVAETLTIDQISSLLRSRPQLLKLFERAENRIFRTLMAGEEVEGWKLVAGKSTRSWLDEDAAFRHLIEKFDPWHVLVPQAPKLASPAQAETLLKRLHTRSDSYWKEFRNMISKPPGGPTLAPESDKRKPWVDDASGDFDEDFSSDFHEED